MLFFLKTKSVFKNENNKIEQGAGLAYSNEILGDLVSRDTDLDGVLNWEESLWGTDPTKRDTNDDGMSDSVEIEKIKSLTMQSEQGESSLTKTENLTETDKFSREFFSTIATLNQNGAMDQATVDKLSSSLAEKIKNSPPRKIFKFSDLKIIEDNSLQAVKSYDNALDNIYKKYPVQGNAMNILQEFITYEDNVNVDTLTKLNPIIEQTGKIIDALVKMSVPQSLASLHLNFTNGLQRLVENLNDIKLYDTDVVIALSAISQYEKNTTLLASANNNLGNAIKQKLSN